MLGGTDKGEKPCQPQQVSKNIKMRAMITRGGVRRAKPSHAIVQSRMRKVMIARIAGTIRLWMQSKPCLWVN